MEQRYGLIGNRPWPEWIAGDVLNYIRQEMDHFLVAVDQSRVVGFIAYRLDPSRRTGTIGYNAVDPAIRGKGVGSKLLDEVISKLRANGMVYAKVVTGLNEGHAPARRMYEKAGFEPLMESVLYSMRL